MIFEIVECLNHRGVSPFGRWFDGLDSQAATKIVVAVRRMEGGNLGDVKAVGDGVMERRIDWGPGLRVYFARDGDKILLLLGGGSKQRQQSDINAARVCWADYKRRRSET